MEFTTLIEVKALRSLLGARGLAVVDCRFDLMKPDAGRQAFLAAHLPGAQYAHLSADLSGPIGPMTGRHPLPAREVFARRLAELGIGDLSQVVAYDDSNGSFAARLWWMLRWLGHGGVAVLDGGFKAWIADGGALESGPPRLAPPELREKFTPRAGAAALLSGAELERALLEPAALLVDARAPERFAGAVEPIDPVAGHVPGAVNHPFGANLDADGRFLPPAELERRWRQRLAGRSAGNVLAMCGSGVTACHNLLALEVAGLKGAKLYAGSWSEWIRDPRRPIARGA